MIDGRYDRVPQLARDLLPALIPVQYTGGKPVLVESISPRGAAEEHPVLNLWAHTQERDDFWKNLPAPPI